MSGETIVARSLGDAVPRPLRRVPSKDKSSRKDRVWSFDHPHPKSVIGRLAPLDERRVEAKRRKVEFEREARAYEASLSQRCP